MNTQQDEIMNDAEIHEFVEQISKEIKSGIQVTLGQLVLAMAALDVLRKQMLPIVISHRLSKIVSAVNLEIEQYNASAKTLYERYAEGEPTVNGNVISYKFPLDKMEDVTKEHNELTSLEVTIPGERFHISELPNVMISEDHLSILKTWLIVE